MASVRTFAAPGPRRPYGSATPTSPLPNLLAVQLDSWEWFRSEGLAGLWEQSPPMTDAGGRHGRGAARRQARVVKHRWGEPERTPEQCREARSTYAAVLYVSVELRDLRGGEVMVQEVRLCSVPQMTPEGTFVIGGNDKVVVSQLLRAPGVYFADLGGLEAGRRLGSAKIIPERGAWVEFRTNRHGVISTRMNQSRLINAITFLMAAGVEDPDTAVDAAGVDPIWGDYETTKSRLSCKSREEAIVQVHKAVRPNEPPRAEEGAFIIEQLLKDRFAYSLGKRGRRRLDAALHGGMRGEAPQGGGWNLRAADLVETLRGVLRVSNELAGPDDIDHLHNREVRTAGQQLVARMVSAMGKVRRWAQQAMLARAESERMRAAECINPKPMAAAVRGFFSSYELCQVSDSTNPLSEITQKRRLTTLGPGGLDRRSAGIDVRDVHRSFYGRICPIETPEGGNIGLVSSLACYSVRSPEGVLLSPYHPVLKTIASTSNRLAGHTLLEDVEDQQGRMVLRGGGAVHIGRAGRINRLPARELLVAPYVSSEVEYLPAEMEEGLLIGQAPVPTSDVGEIVGAQVEAREADRVVAVAPSELDYVDVAPQQVFSPSAMLIPFMEHNDANRALMGANMQRQAVPLLRPEAPIVATGMEADVGQFSGRSVVCDVEGVVVSATAERVVVWPTTGRRRERRKHVFRVRPFGRSSSDTCVAQRVTVRKGDRVSRGDVLADGYAIDGGELALGQNVLVAYMCDEGNNYEDSIVVSERLLQSDKFASTTVKVYEVDAEDSADGRGKQIITRDLAGYLSWAAEEGAGREYSHLDARGVACAGATVGPGDIVVGRVAARDEEPDAADRLLSSASTVQPGWRDRCLKAKLSAPARVVRSDVFVRKEGPDGSCVVSVEVVDGEPVERETGEHLPPSVHTRARVWLAQKRPLRVGDKMAGRHGNKGLVSRIRSEAEMPYLPDGTPVEVLLTPLGVPSRMNMGQLMETHLGYAAHRAGVAVESPSFDSATYEEIQDALGEAWLIEQAGAEPLQPGDSPDLEALREWMVERHMDYVGVFEERTPGAATRACLSEWLKSRGVVDVDSLSAAELAAAGRRREIDHHDPPPTSGKSVLYDGLTGERFERPVTVGYKYMLKLNHMAEDKLHTRSTGGYSAITQQPMGGKAAGGGQRFGEMEVWALEGYSAAHTLREMLTLKSDDRDAAELLHRLIRSSSTDGLTGDDSVPRSFDAMVHELGALGLSMELLVPSGDGGRWEDPLLAAIPRVRADGLVGTS